MANLRNHLRVSPLDHSKLTTWANHGRRGISGWTAVADAEVQEATGILIRNDRTRVLALLTDRGTVRSVPQRRTLDALRQNVPDTAAHGGR